MTAHEIREVFKVAFTRAIEIRYTGGCDTVETSVWLMDVERRLNEDVPLDYWESATPVIKHAIISAQDRVNEICAQLINYADHYAEAYCMERSANGGDALADIDSGVDDMEKE